MQVVPRHNEIEDFLARAICRKLDLPDPRRHDR
jgi:inactivated superfamily I helicase